MPSDSDADLTLPSVQALLPEAYRRGELLVTLIFHPCLDRIGEYATVPNRAAEEPWQVGRGSPLFNARNDEVSQPLRDPHVSRRAFELSIDGEAVLLQKNIDGCRVRLDGGELESSVRLDARQLQRGVPILLGHSVVLLLRRNDAPTAAKPEPCGGSTFGSSLLGSGAWMASLRAQLRTLAAHDGDILIRGETGTGKELVAAEIHRISERAEGPLINVNMAAIPEPLAAAALFGNSKGAFTGAGRAALGYFEQAQGGSLFLDEIGDTPAEVQPLLLRALQQREIQPLGGPIRRVDLRVISATDAPLDGPDCGFSAALRHRLGAHEILLRPLRDHPEDVGELCVHYLRKSVFDADRDELLPNESTPASITALWAELFFRFVCYSWPGNVRELANYSDQLVLSSARQVVIPENISKALGAQDRGLSAVLQTQGDDTVAAAPRRRRMSEIGSEEFQLALREADYEIAPTAKRLGVSRQAVYRRIENSVDYCLASELEANALQHTLLSCDGDVEAAAAILRVSAAGLRARLRYSGSG